MSAEQTVQMDEGHLFNFLVGSLPGLWVGEILERKQARERRGGGALRKVLAYICFSNWCVVLSTLSYTQTITHRLKWKHSTYTYLHTGYVELLSAECVSEAAKAIYLWFDMVWMFKLDRLSAKSAEFQLLFSFYHSSCHHKPAVWVFNFNYTRAFAWIFNYVYQVLVEHWLKRRNECSRGTAVCSPSDERWAAGLGKKIKRR